jgi:Lsr2
MQVLSVLTPPLLMCAVVLIAVGAFLRHEMRRKRPDDAGHADDIQSAPSISGEHAESKSGSDTSAHDHKR